MLASQSAHGTGRLMAWFVAAAFVPTASLGLLGWRMAAQDRDLERDRHRIARERAVELAATTFQRIVAELDAQLAPLDVSAVPASFPNGVAAVLLDNGRLVAHAGDADGGGDELIRTHLVKRDLRHGRGLPRCHPVGGALRSVARPGTGGRRLHGTT